MKVKSLSRVLLLKTTWTAAYQAPPPMGFSRQEYWSGLLLPSPYGVRKCFNFVLLHVAVQFSQHHLLKKLSFSLEASDRQLVTQFSETLGLANLERDLPGHLLAPQIPRMIEAWHSA